MSEKAIIVDEHDNPIGVKNRKDITGDDIYRVSSLWITNSKGEILLARRAYTESHDPGMWGPAANGTVEEGETYESNIIKEAEEELGLTNLKIEIGEKHESHRTWHYFVQRFRATVDVPIEAFRYPKDEVAEMKWFTEDELRAAIAKNPDEFLHSVQYYFDK